VTDLFAEVHDAHHPLGTALYYEDQKPAAKKRAAMFRKERMPKFLRYFERVLERNVGGRHRWLVGKERSYSTCPSSGRSKGSRTPFLAPSTRSAPRSRA
jgi:glutathione S-transferase